MSMGYQWAIGYYIGEQAKSIIEHANAGIGYFLIEQGRQGNQATAQAAFRHAMDGPMPEHLSLVTAEGMIRKLNDRWDARHGVDRREATPQPASQQKMMEIRETLSKRLKRRATPAPVDLGGAV